MWIVSWLQFLIMEWRRRRREVTPSLIIGEIFRARCLKRELFRSAFPAESPLNTIHTAAGAGYIMIKTQLLRQTPVIIFMKSCYHLIRSSPATQRLMSLLTRLKQPLHPILLLQINLITYFIVLDYILRLCFCSLHFYIHLQ